MNKTVLITGATGKLGSAIARHLAPLGWNLVLTSRDPRGCEPLADELRAIGVKVQSLALDLLNDDSTESLADRVAEAGFSVTHVVSNARSVETLQLDKDGSARAREFNAEISIHVVAPYRMLMAFVRNSHHQLRGIVAVGSQYGEVAPTPALYGGELDNSPVQYGVAKAALHHMTRELAVRLAPDVRVNCVAFGGFAGRTDAAFERRYASLTPLARMLDESDAGGPVAFLLDDAAAAAITGHVLVADGGWSIW